MSEDREHSKYSQFYSHIKAHYEVQSALFRFSVVSRVGNSFDDYTIIRTQGLESFLTDIQEYIAKKSEAPGYDKDKTALNDIINALYNAEDKSVKRLDIVSSNTISRKPMTERLERLMFMYGAEVITPHLFRNLSSLPDSTNIDNVLEEAEIFLIEQAKIDNEQSADTSAVEVQTFQKILECAVKSRTEFSSNSVSFSEIVDLMRNNTLVDIYDGRIKVIDKGFFEFLAQQNERFAYCIDGQVTVEQPSNIIRYTAVNEVTDENSDEEQMNEGEVKGEWVLNEHISEIFSNGRFDDNYFPYIENPRRLMVYLKLYKQPYCERFLVYAQIHLADVPFSAYPEKYREFADELLFSFNIMCSERKRKVCGAVPNWFDYVRSLSTREKAETRTIRISEGTSGEDDWIKALKTYINTYPAGDESVFEVYHLGTMRMYMLKNREFVPVDTETYTKQLFDYNDVYRKIQEFTQSGHKITVNKVTGSNKIEIYCPQEFKDCFTEDELPFAEGLVAEQCARYSEKKSGNVVYTDLNKLKQLAAEQKKAEELKKLADAMQKTGRRTNKNTLTENTPPEGQGE